MIRCRSFAEIPVRRVEISKIALNHTLSGLWVFSSSVPDVRLVWCPQSAHSNAVPPGSSTHASRCSARTTACQSFRFVKNPRSSISTKLWRNLKRPEPGRTNNKASKKLARGKSYPAANKGAVDACPNAAAFLKDQVNSSTLTRSTHRSPRSHKTFGTQICLAH
jgi:hypothetical protein